ncbi:MAG: hypothetical protein RIC55_07980 [Pirellulaceae bacterium]
MSRQNNSRRPKRLSIELAKVIAGGLAGVAAAVLVAWYGFSQDPLGIFAAPNPKVVGKSGDSKPDDKTSKPPKKVTRPDPPKSPETPAADDTPHEEPKSPLSGTVAVEPPSVVEPPETGEDTKRLFATPTVARDEPSKHPAPDAETYNAKLAEVTEIYRKEFVAADSAESKAALAVSLMEFADGVKGDPAARFVVLRESLMLASNAGGLKLGENAINKLLADFELDENLLRAFFLLSVAENVQTTADRNNVASASLSLVPQLVDVRRLDEALQLAESAQSLALRSKNTGLRVRAREQIDRIAALHRELEIVELARKALESTPDDPRANLIYGRFLCLTDGAWDKGLSMLANGSDDFLRRLAQADIESPDTPAGMLEVGDAWYDFSRAEKENEGFGVRAAHWYEQCLEMTTGLTRAKIEKRIDELRPASTLPPLPGESPALDVAMIGPEGKRFEGHEDAVVSVEFSNRGGWLLSASADGTARLWDVATGRELRRIGGDEESLRAARFTPDEKRVVSCGWDGTIRVWDLATTRQVLQINADAEVVYDVSLSPDGSTIASCGRDGIVHLWSAKSGDELAQFTGHKGYVLAVKFSSDGKYVASAGRDTIVRLWDVATKHEAERFLGGTGAFLHSIDVSAETGQVLVGGGGGAWLWRRGNARPKVQFNPQVNTRGVAFSPDARYVALAGGNKEVVVLDSETGRAAREFRQHTDIVRCVAFSRDGELLASGGGGEVVDNKMLEGDDFSIRIHQTNLGE